MCFGNECVLGLLPRAELERHLQFSNCQRLQTVSISKHMHFLAWDVFSKGQVEFIKYLSESPEEKTMNRNELCGRSILSWNIIEATYVFLRCFRRLEFALCRIRRDILKTGSTFYPRPTIGYANCNQGTIHFRQFPTILAIITHLIKT